MHDILDIIKNLQTLSESNSAFRVLKDFERVIDELDVYVFNNWLEGELVEGPFVNRYDVTCKFMWPLHSAPDPKGGKRLVDYGCSVIYKKTKILMPRKIKDPADFRPGTKKGKIDAHSIWIVEITMPKKLMQDVLVGSENKENNIMAELMKYHQSTTTPEETGQIENTEIEQNAAET